MLSLNDLNKQIQLSEPTFLRLFQNCMGWRGIFDPYCDEYKNTTLEQKASVVRIAMNYIRFDELVALWKATETRDYVLQDLPDALEKLATVMPEITG